MMCFFFHLFVFLRLGYLLLYSSASAIDFCVHISFTITPNGSGINMAASRTGVLLYYMRKMPAGNLDAEFCGNFTYISAGNNCIFLPKVITKKAEHVTNM
jgi:hypothetical protein